MQQKKCLHILFVTPSPPNHLNRVRSLNLIRSFKALGHQVSLISLYKTDKEKQELDYIGNEVDYSEGIYQPFVRSLICSFIGLFLPIPLRVAFCFSPQMRKRLIDLNSKNKYDLVYIKRLRMAQYANIFNPSNLFIDITDSMTKYYENLLKVSKGVLSKLLCYEEYMKHNIYEAKICRKHKNIVICSPTDRDYLVNKRVDADNFFVLENGILIDDWRFRFNEFTGDKPIKLLFRGVMNVDTNIRSVEYFIKEVFPLLPENYSFTVVGPKPPKSLKSFSSSRIVFLGHIDNLKDIISDYHIFVCPIVSGAGTKNKILQAGMSGIPIITTSLGLDGLNNKLRKIIKYSDSAKEMSEQIVELSALDQNTLKNDSIKIRDEICNHYNVLKIVESFIKRNYHE